MEEKEDLKLFKISVDSGHSFSEQWMTDSEMYSTRMAHPDWLIIETHTTPTEKKTIKYCIKDTITDDYLIEHYGFSKEEWHDTYNLVKEVDEYGLGLHIWWADRNVKILLGGHDEYGIIPIPQLLIQMIKDGVIIEKEMSE